MSRTVDLVSTAQEAGRRVFRDSEVVVIDVFRATTTILTCLERGAARVHPVAEVEAARELRERLSGALLAGEREGVPPPGFDFGNSPVEMASASLLGASIVLTTTNGTLAVHNVGEAARITLACVRNARAVGRAHADGAGPVVVVCAGTEGALSIEDVYAAGLVAVELNRAGWRLTDAAWAAALLAERPVEQIVNADTCRHYRNLVARGLGDDIPYCLQRDCSSVVPVFREGDPSGYFVPLAPPDGTR